MGRGGHHYSGGHYHRYRGSDGGNLKATMIGLLIGFGVLFIINTVENDNIRNGEKISGDYILTEYLYDEADYFDDRYEHLVIEGLQYFYQTTGAQMVIVTQDERITDKLTEEKYYEMFDDGAHILIVLPMTPLLGTNNVQYYYMGDEALKVIDETRMNRMLENIDYSLSSREEKWKEEIIDIANLIVS
mgnify:CR=1 FL=1